MSNFQFLPEVMGGERDGEICLNFLSKLCDTFAFKETYETYQLADFYAELLFSTVCGFSV